MTYEKAYIVLNTNEGEKKIKGVYFHDKQEFYAYERFVQMLTDECAILKATHDQQFEAIQELNQENERLREENELLDKKVIKEDVSCRETVERMCKIIDARLDLFIGEPYLSGNMDGNSAVALRDAIINDLKKEGLWEKD